MSEGGTPDVGGKRFFRKKRASDAKNDASDERAAGSRVKCSVYLPKKGVSDGDEDDSDGMPGACDMKECVSGADRGAYGTRDVALTGGRLSRGGGGKYERRC